MPNAVTTENRQGNQGWEQFMSALVTEERRDELVRCLPRHISYDHFERNLLNALMSNPELSRLNIHLLWREVAKSAQLGLVLDPQLGEAYMIIARGKGGNKEPQLRVGYRGLIKLARQSGQITSIYAHEVCENDRVECSLGDDKKLIHEPTLFGPRGDVIGYYAVVKFDNGESDFEPMNREEVERIRDEKSDGYKAFKAGKIRSTPWDTDFDEMAKKTCIRRLLKRIPQSPELQSALIHEGALDYGAIEARDIPEGERPTRPTLQSVDRQADAIDVADDTGEPDFSFEIVDWEGAIVEFTDPAEYTESLCASIEAAPDFATTQAMWQDNDVSEVLFVLAGLGRRDLVKAINTTYETKTDDLREAELAAQKAEAEKPQDDGEAGELPLEGEEEREAPANPAGIEIPMKDGRPDEKAFRSAVLDMLTKSKSKKTLESVEISALGLCEFHEISAYTKDQIKARATERRSQIGK